MSTVHGHDRSTTIATYHAAIEKHIGTRTGRLTRAGTTVHPIAQRDESGVSSAYRIGPSTTIWCAPRHADPLAELVADDTLGLDAYDSWCADRGGELVGGGMSLLLDDVRPRPASIPAGGQSTLIDREVADQVAAVRAFVAELDPDDVDAAEVDPDDIDPAAVLLRDRTGSSVAFASWLPWDIDSRFGDVGVLTSEAHRGEGWGRAAVALAIGIAFERGIIPLYRCNDDNEPSWRLAESLGFRQISRLRAWRLP
jgi:GNAT superfamily N-acetyltransferase